MTIREADDVTVAADERHEGRAVVNVEHGNYTTSLRVSDGELRRIRDAIDRHLSVSPADEARVLSIAAEIVSERGRQDAKWGAPHDVTDGTGRHLRLGEPFANISFRMMRDAMQRNVDARAERGESTMATVLLEEVFEALAESDEQKLRAELVQVAAVAAKWVQIIDARDIS